MILWEDPKADDDKSKSVLREHFITTIARRGEPLTIRVRAVKYFPDEYALDLKTAAGSFYICTIAQIHDLGDVRADLLQWFEDRGVWIVMSMVHLDITDAPMLHP